jgi:MFS transporter, DHA2 family, multidrug resistance protein
MSAAPPVNKWLVTVSITFGTLMGALDSSIVNVAMPHIRGTVGATIEEITWISTGYIIANVLVMPLTAFLGSFFGQKRLYMFCLGLFLVGSAMCGLARTLPTLIACRILQGLGAGALQPTEQAILRQTFPPEEQGMAMAVFGVAVMIGPAIGPTLGGWLTDTYSWPWIFYVNLPVGLLGLVMVFSFVHEPEDVAAAARERAEKARKHFDWQGIALMCVGLGALQTFLEQGDRDDWFNSAFICALALIAAVSLTAFVIRELAAEAPAVNLRILRDRTFTSGTLISAMMFAVLFTNMFFLPLFMEEMLGFSTLQAGITVIPRSLVMFLVTPIVGKLYNYVSPRIVVGFGVLVVAASTYLESHFTLATGASGIYFPLILQGLGFSCLFVPLITASLSTVTRRELTDATGLSSLVRQVGGSIGVAIFATVFERDGVRSQASLVAHLGATRSMVVARLAMLQSGLASRGAAAAHQAALAVLNLMSFGQASVLAFERNFLLQGLCFLLCLPLLWFLKAARVTPGAEPLVIEG